MGTYYDIVGVERNATDKDIKSAFRVKVRTAHPDTAKGTNEKFIELREAYDTLIDPIKRQEYDEHLAHPEQPRQEVRYEQPAQKPEYQTSTQPQNDEPEKPTYSRKYSVNYSLLFKWFIGIFSICMLISVYAASSIINKSNYFVVKNLHIDQLVVLVSVGMSVLVGSLAVFSLHKMRLDSWVFVCMKFLGPKLTKLIIKILMIRPPRVFSLVYIRYIALAYVVISAGLILVDLYRVNMQNWVVLTAGLSIIGGIFVELRVRYGLYFIYLTCISSMVAGLILVTIDLVQANYAGLLLKVTAIAAASSFLIYAFNRRYWFH